jgi:hypothetical protein
MVDMVPTKDPVTGIITFVQEMQMVNAEQAKEMLKQPHVEAVQVPPWPNAPQDKDDVAGEDYDPYGHCDGSGYDQFTDIHSPYIPFHNYRQIHVALAAAYKGYNSTRPLPSVPALWGDVGHYWNFGVFVGYGTYEAIRVFGGLVIAAITMYAASKGIVAL